MRSLSENDIEKSFGAETFAKFVSYAKEKLKSTNEILSTLESVGEDLRALATDLLPALKRRGFRSFCKREET
ncbi:MAG: hypothetical protein RXR51_07000 [Nitrososphaeria archaeon]